MKTENDIFKEKQYIISLIISIIVAIFLLFIIYFLKSNDSRDLIAISLISVFLIFLLSLFYKLETQITNKELTIKFGIGFIKKNWQIDGFELSKTKINSFPWYYGVGIRFFNKGVLYNANYGEAIGFFDLKSKSYIYIGTKKGKIIENFINKT